MDNCEYKYFLLRRTWLARLEKGKYDLQDKVNQTLNETQNVILTADNITLDGHFDVKKKVFLVNDLTLDADKKLGENDIFICFSSGSKKHVGKVAFIDSDTNYYAGGFMGIIRCFDSVLVKNQRY